MIKLLRANFARLFKDTAFLIVAGGTLGITIARIIDCAITNKKYAALGETDSGLTMKSVLFELMPAIGIFCAIFIAFYIGKEFSQNAMRNKIIAGHSRTNIYLSNFITCLAGSLILFAIIVSGSLCLGIPLIGPWEGKVSDLILSLLISAFFTASMAAIAAMICMVCSKRSVSAVISILIVLALLILASTMYNALFEPEMMNGMQATINGIEFTDPQPNPLYVGGVRRQIYEFLVQFLPTGQGILVANEEVTQPVLNIIYSVITMIAVNLCGIFTFSKKDIR